MPAGRVFVVTGPSGVGKGTLIRTLRERMPELELSVSATTRAPRPGERDGGAMKTRTASGSVWATCRAPWTSISSTTGCPPAMRPSSSERSVP